MAKRKNIFCALRKGSEKNNGYVFRDAKSDKIVIQYTDKHNIKYMIANLDTYTARLMARRINQFIDAGG